MSRSDAEIVQAVRAGDKQAFGEVIERYWGMVYGIAYQRLAEPMLAEDRAQEAFLQAFLSLEHLQKPEQFRAWLYGITLNCCKNFFRKQRQIDVCGDIEDYLEYAPSPENLAESIETRSSLESALAQLSPANQEAIILFYYEGFSLKEIAEILQISPTAVKGRLHKSRRALKDQLARLFPSSIRSKGAKKMIPVQVIDTPQQIKSSPEGESLRYSQILLFNEESRRALVVWLWEEEQALAIAQLLTNYSPQRPKQHDFAAKLIEATGATLEYVLLDKLPEGIPFATLSLNAKTGKSQIDARVGEAIALALYLKAPIYVSERSWENASKPLPADKNPNRKGLESIIARLESLREHRQIAAQKQDWLKLRQELNKSIAEQARAIIDEAFS